MNRPSKPFAALLAVVFSLQGVPVVVAQVAQPPAAPPASAAAPQAPSFKPEELEQLVAPIALYPDALVAQVLMASTYPLEIVAAARWQRENPNLKGKALEDALQQQPWDPSVKSLTAFPQVLTMMNEKLDWSQRLGDAFLAQQSDVMDAVQRLRVKAEAAGNLKSNAQQKVTVKQAPANVTVEQAAAPPPVIIIEPADPQVVYVPTYNPTVVYGPWPYAAYPPYYYYPPGYVATTSLISFGVGMAVGAALWGGCSWGWGGHHGHNDIDINVNRYNSFNRTNISNNKWQHNVDHRKGVPYRDKGSQQRYGRSQQAGAASREAFRGRADKGGMQGGRGEGGRPDAGRAGREGQIGSRGGDRQPGQARRESSAPSRAKTVQQRQPGAFGDTGNGKQARRESQRGHQSQQVRRGGGGGDGGRRGGGGGGGGGGRKGGGGGGGGGRRR